MSQIPVTVIGGFLGSGKTTLLNHLLSKSSGVRYAVMVNDFGSLAIDENLVKEHNGDTISFANGCVCCALGDNLVASIDKLLASQFRPEQILIEVSGVANPKALADVATLHPELKRDLIITLVDAQSVQDRLADERLTDTVMMQLAPADLIVLNKCDLVEAEQLSAIQVDLAPFHRGQIVHAVKGHLPRGVLSNKALTSFNDDASATNQQDRQWDHHPESQFHRITVPLPETYDRAALKAVLKKYQSILLRAKGFIKEGESNWFEIQLSGKRIDSEGIYDGSHLDDPNGPGAVLVAIGLEPLDQFAKEISKDHHWGG